MRFRFALGIGFILALLAFCWWWGQPATLQQPPVATPPATPPPPPPPQVVVAPAPAQPAQVVAPVVRPVPVSPSSIAPAPAPVDPRLAPDTAMGDMLGMVQSGDYVTAAETYLQLPPNVSAAQLVASLEQNADFPQTIQMTEDTMMAAQSVTPVYNDAGNLATYTLPAPVDGKTIVRWKKIGDQWYLDALDGPQ